MNGPAYDKLHPRYAWMRDYLASVAPPGALPGRQHIDPIFLRTLLPLINLVDVLRENDRVRFRFRLVGTRQAEVTGRNYTGEYIDTGVLPAFLERVRNNMQAAVATGSPVYDRFPLPFKERDFIDSERVFFPLAADGENVDLLLILHGYPSDHVIDAAKLPSLYARAHPTET
jgi:hypothetical protein